MSNLLEKALAFATEAHKDQTRKTGGPFIEHPKYVAQLLTESGATLEAIAAGFLHDVVEDTSKTFEDIEPFGQKVLHFVKLNTEDKDKDWLERKLHTHQQIPYLTIEERLFIIADKFANVTSMKSEFDSYKEEFWTFFNKGYEHQRWYYKGIALLMFVNLPENVEIPPLFYKYKELTDEFFDK